MKRILSLFLCVMMCLGLLCLAVPDSRADSNPVKKNGRSVSSADELRRYDIVTFGTYPLRSYDDDAPIEWIVIKKSGTRVTLVTRDLIDSQTFHHTAAGAVTWQSCDLNRWLNDTFLESAFTSKEQDMITGSVTIPSLAEARSMPADMLNPVFTPYAIERGGNSSLIIWWLRDGSKVVLFSNGNKMNCASAVRQGSVLEAAYAVTFSGKGVRPMIQIDFDWESSTPTPGGDDGLRSTGLMMKGSRAVTSIDDIKKYDDVTFGSYPQDSYGDYERIHWIVIGKRDSRVKLLSALALDCKEYQSPYAATSWRFCSLNTWLNDEFKDYAFSSAEKATLTGDVTILSEAEARELPVDIRATRSTDYAISRGADESQCLWWLRDAMMRKVESTKTYELIDIYCASVVLANGELASGAYRVDMGHKTVRPVIEVDMDLLSR